MCPFPIIVRGSPKAGIGGGGGSKLQRSQGQAVCIREGSAESSWVCGEQRGLCPPNGQIITKSHVGLASTGLIFQAKLDIEILL